jgi:CRISPR/Cas system-associated exonuclease Cas4 (RecB family)
MEKRGLGISQTALNVFRNCPFAFKLYKEKREAVMYSQDVLDAGKFVHDTLHCYYRNHFLTSGTAEDVLSYTYDILKGMWDTTLPTTEFKKAYTCLESHSLFEYENLKNGIITNPSTEVQLATDVFFGIVDYIDLNHDNVIDWKTNRIATLSHEYKIQAYIYKLLFEENFKRPLDHLTFYFLFPNEKRTVWFNEGMRDIKNEVDKLMCELRTMMEVWEFPKQPRTESGCNSCAYRLYCKY